jgi:sulfur carrier protein
LSGIDEPDSGPTITIVVNGEPRVVPAQTSVTQLLAMAGIEPRGVAVAVDRTVLSRDAWPAALLSDGASVEVVTAVAGG